MFKRAPFDGVDFRMRPSFYDNIAKRLRITAYASLQKRYLARLRRQKRPARLQVMAVAVKRPVRSNGLLDE
jgi:hypothetical protein